MDGSADLWSELDAVNGWLLPGLAASVEWRAFLATEASPAAHIRSLALGSGVNWVESYYDGIYLEREAVVGSLAENYPGLFE